MFFGNGRGNPIIGLGKSINESRLRKERVAQRIIEVQHNIKQAWQIGDLNTHDLAYLLAFDELQKDPKRSKAVDQYIETTVTDQILPLIHRAIGNNQLELWNADKSIRLNERILDPKQIPDNSLILKADFFRWQQITKQVAIPELLKDLGVCHVEEMRGTRRVLATHAQDEALKQALSVCGVTSENRKIRGSKRKVRDYVMQHPSYKVLIADAAFNKSWIRVFNENQ